MSKAGLILPGKFKAEKCGLAVSESITKDDWRCAGIALSEIDKRLMWCIGDWINAGERKWGAIYQEAEEITGFAYQTLRNAASVCTGFELSRRRDNLTFTHHADVAGLDRKSVV